MASKVEGCDSSIPTFITTREVVSLYSTIWEVGRTGPQQVLCINP